MGRVNRIDRFVKRVLHFLLNIFYTRSMLTFGEWFGQELDRRKLGLRQAATFIGVSHTTVKLWKSGAVLPSWENCAAIARALKADPDYVRQLAGYGDAAAVREEGAQYIARNEDERKLLDAYRTTKREEHRALLLSAAEVILETTAGAG